NESEDLTPDVPLEVPLRAEPPTAKRLNRNALIVVALVLGLTAMVVVITMRPSVSVPVATGPAADTKAPTQAPPTFLDRPVATPATRDSERGEHAAGAGAPFAGEHGTQPFASPPAPNTFGSAGAMASAPSIPGWEGAGGDPYAIARAQASAASLPHVATVTPREASYLRALHSSPVGDGERADALGKGSGESLAPTGQSPTPDTTTTVDGSGPSSNQASNPVTGVPLGGAGTPATPVAVSSGGRASYTAFLNSAAGSTPTVLRTSVQPPPSPFVLKAGTVVSGLLISGVVSDLPGEIIGQVSRDVYDSPTQRILLIPKGAKLIGTYDNGITLGQSRLLVAWTQLVFPDGRSLTLPGLGISDEHGSAGVKDQVDNHYRRLFGNAILLSAISAGLQLSQPSQNTSGYTTPSAGQTAAGAVGQELGNVSTQMIQRNMDIAPTITIRPGTPFTVLLRGDVVLLGPYDATDEHSSEIVQSQP
ncbi:MAG TPA: TrbI/VirB10 family protein, partial [Gemmatimonadaceae bacterium]|nr:TrbI/VirB10 family protein [Gemmatimonadaceae bacterium]